MNKKRNGPGGLALAAVAALSAAFLGCENSGNSASGDPVVGHYLLVAYRVEAGGPQPTQWSGEGAINKGEGDLFWYHLKTNLGEGGAFFHYKRDTHRYAFDGSVFSYTRTIDWSNAPSTTYYAEWKLQ